MIYYSGHFPPSSGGGVVGTSLVDLTATSFADIFALATDYSSGTVYKKGDVVYNQSALWVYINNTNDSGNPPPTLPAVSNSWWEFIGSRGTFTWIAYGNSIDGGVTITDFTTGVYNSGGIVREFIGMAVNKTAATESTNPADYTWSKFVGKDGNDGNDGSDGIDAITGMLTNESVQLFAYANGGIVSYTPATGYFKVYSGNTDISANFSLSTLTNPQNLTVVYTGGLKYSVTGGIDDTEDTASVTIRATGSGSYAGIVIDKVFSIAKSRGGYEIVSELPISNLFQGRLVFLETDGKLYRYTGSGWTAETATTDLIGKITTEQIENNSIVAELIAENAIDVTKFASSIEPVSLVNSVPTIKSTSIIYNTTNGKTYKWQNGAYTEKVIAVDIDARGLDILDDNGVPVFGSDGSIGNSANLTVNGNTISLSEVAANALTPSLHYVGTYTSNPTEPMLGSNWKQNAVYKNSTNGKSYVLTGTPLVWEEYLQDGTTFLLTIESTNGTIFRVGQNSFTTLKARLFKNGAEVTDVTPDSWFRWRRTSLVPQQPPNDDATWNNLYQSGYKQVTIGVDSVYAKATFFCDVIN